MQGKAEVLFTPITIGKVQIKNRVGMAPMGTRFGDADGCADAQLISYFNARAKGGVGLIICPVSPSEWVKRGRLFGLGLFNEPQWVKMAGLVEQIHLFGAKVFLQIVLGWGRQVAPELNPDPSREPVSASPVPYHIEPSALPQKMVKYYARIGRTPWPVRDGPIPREATIEEIVAIEDAVARTTRVAMEKCEADGIEIHACHGYFGFSFLSPRLNVRTDHYGGSFENRMRFLRNCYNKARNAVGEDFVIGVRLSLDEHVAGGLTIEDTKVMCQELEELGINYISFSDGCLEALKYTYPDEDGTMLEEVGSVKKVVKIPVMIPSIYDPDIAENAIKEEKTDMILLGRQLLCDPEWVNKVARGRRPVRCIRCNSDCLGRLLEKGLPIRCVLNKELGFEQYNPDYYPSMILRIRKVEIKS